MRLNNDLRKCVIFLGYADPVDPDHSINVVGTGFFLVYENDTHLVTVRHVARDLQDVGWVARVNLFDGSCRNLISENVKWAFHSDPTVDLAITTFAVTPEAVRLFDHQSMSGDYILTDELITKHAINTGDFCFTIGLFHFLKGKKRNLPVVHAGTIALMPGDERVPIRDWEDDTKTKHVEAFLIESQSMPGLSGSPVLVQPTIAMRGMRLTRIDGTEEIGTGLLSDGTPLLLGVFQAAWQAQPSEIIAIERGRPTVVPVGMGVVVPAQKIFEVLEMPELKVPRDERNRRREHANAASPSSVPRSTVSAGSALPAKAPEGDDRHKERFTALLDEAVEKPKRDD